MDIRSMDKMILLTVLKNNLILLAKLTHNAIIKENSPENGDITLENVALYKDGTLTKWLDGLIATDSVKIYSDDILTMATPSDQIIKKYLELFEQK